MHDRVLTPTLSLQLYSLRDLGSLDEQLRAASDAGFLHVEPLETHLRDPKALSAGLNRYGLKAPTAHASLSGLEADVPFLLDACVECGVETIFAPHAWRTFTRDDVAAWQRLGSDLARVAELMARKDISFGYHNKSAGLAPMRGGRCGMDVLFEAARGSPLLWQADIGWLHSAGANPSEWLRRYARLLVSAHVKDRAPEGVNAEEEGWADVGAGVMLWPSLWKEALDHGAKTLVVEHDKPADPAEFARRSFKYLSRFLPQQSTDRPSR